METFWQDTRQAVRMLIRNPGFSVIAILALALGIGPNAAIFSAVHALLLTPPPYQDPDAIVSITQMRDVTGTMQKLNAISTDDFQTWRSSTKMLDQMAIYSSDTLSLTGLDEPVRLTGARVSPALFPLLRVGPLLGRALLPDEEKAGKDRVVLLSYLTWVNRFGRDPNMVGKFIKLDGNDYLVAGVMPQAFAFPNKETEYWVPLVLDPPQQGGNVRSVMMMPAIARLKPGVTAAQAEAEGTALLQQGMLQEARVLPISGGPVKGSPPEAAAVKGLPQQGAVVKGLPQEGGAMKMPPPGGNAVRGLPQGGGHVKLTTLQEQSVGPIRPALLVLMIAVGFVLLIACANVANLLLSRAVDRQKEISIRASLGAGRWRIIRQMLTESTLLSLLGGAVGLLLGFWGIMLLTKLSPGNIPHLDTVKINGSALGFALVLSLLTGLLFGLAPALKSARGALMQSLKEGEAQASAGLHLFRRKRREACWWSWSSLWRWFCWSARACSSTASYD